ncbi:hypothetical protein SAMN05421823_101392 [Catalinimonas alkaloidigena]|uniref:Uncharacterized protein n=1 Tax=Catalinimonas alkaloidigena TaxID=1075417 RepID=A0A1G8XJW1_9BACT|nr:SiaB family protein kinase [Catalinimonas alkaloidigena]SDJ90871.1 hypothetical protein SAMN05421823_101392 [Catalinimonas alkaloidigena]
MFNTLPRTQVSAGAVEAPYVPDLRQFHQRMQADNVILAYRGDLSSNIISCILQLAEVRFSEMKVETLLRKRLLNVLIESLQNVFHHADCEGPSRKYGDSVLIISRILKRYFVFTGNYIVKEKSTQLSARLDKINLMSKEELRLNYRSILANKDFSRTRNRNGAGIGILDIARRSGNKIQYEIQPIDAEYDFFSMEVCIDA